MKKVVIIVIIILIVVSAFGLIFLKKTNKEENKVVVENKIDISQYYGKRGNISETERIKFLSKNDEYLVGMMGISVSNEIKSFTNDEMIRFALNIAVQRYATMFEKKKNKDGTFNYIITQDVVDQITSEFFGIDSVEFDRATNEYYSTSSKAFLFNESIEKTLYYYPVTQEEKGDNTVEIIVDAIFVEDIDPEILENAKYEGKYTKENVDNTVKFIFNENGKLISYQYM